MEHYAAAGDRRHDNGGGLCRVRDHRTANVAGAVSPGSETGQHRPPRRRHCSRFQQPADRHQRIQHDVAGSAARKRPESGLCQTDPRRRLARGQSHETAIDLQPKTAHSAPPHGPRRGRARVTANPRASDRGRHSAGHDIGPAEPAGDGRPRPDPSGDHESGRERPRCDAGWWRTGNLYADRAGRDRRSESPCRTGRRASMCC